MVRLQKIFDFSDSNCNLILYCFYRQPKFFSNFFVGQPFISAQLINCSALLGQFVNSLCDDFFQFLQFQILFCIFLRNYLQTGI